MGKLLGRALVSLAAMVVAALLLTPVATASPIGDAETAMMAAWDKAGGDSSPLGARKGDVYPVGDGFALEFVGGKMYFTPDTGAKFVYGPILEKYESLGGPAGSDLGFPTINEVPGLAGPDSRVATFSASDKPVIYWTADHGAHVVRGALNAAWDKLGSSGGALGVPVADESYDGDVVSQKFSGGAVSWNRKTKQFSAEPAVLGGQLKDLQVVIDPAAAINMAWRAAGGAAGRLGAKKGGQNPIGGDGIAQEFAGGKVYYSPATGANAVESDILAKYESLGGPVGSELGFPVANESDGAIPSSRIAVFSGPDKPVIFWTPDHGAFVVRGAVKVAWDKLKGPLGKLGAPVGDQAVDGDIISQKFTGGMISWNRASNTFSTDPANLAPLLSGLQVPGQNQPSGAASPAHPKKFGWHWWYLLAIIPLLMLLLSLFLVLNGRRRHSRAREAAYAYETSHYDPDHGPDPGYDVTAAESWANEDAEFASRQQAPADTHAPEEGPASRISWSRSAATAVAAENEPIGAEYGRDSLAGPDAASRENGADAGFEEQGENPDDVDTTSIPVLTDTGIPDSGNAVDVVSGGAPTGSTEEDFGEEPRDVGYPEEVFAEAPPEDSYSDDLFAEAPPEADYSDDVFAEAPPEAGYPQEVFAEAPPEASYSDDVFAEAPPEASYSDDVFAEDAGPQAAFPDIPPGPEASEAAGAAAAAASVTPPRTGRHAAADEAAEMPDEIPEEPEAEAGASVAPRQPQPARPTIHLPLDDPYQPPEGYPIKASARFGLYYTPSSELYENTLPEFWLASEEVAEANGFTKAD
ncbi:hypothetical protein A9W99_10850 [Mycobacterium sp. 1164966.3]|uniref:LGFP repeat-containing protein n=1 Tax=Mycobacterium sp. 1164966.3 TaxID=1856861 RepID=UPI0008017715|nr:hypothetical protein [Mycobacterium sp. 1164966.3]OBA82610.1 hypothetical protein A9W99_10850 [Mycobacterium sp. 1164966.3]